MNPWDANNHQQRCIEAVARALISAEGKSTKPDDRHAFFDPFSWAGELKKSEDGYRPVHERPAWTGFRVIRMANAAIIALAACDDGGDNDPGQ